MKDEGRVRDAIQGLRADVRARAPGPSFESVLRRRVVRGRGWRPSAAHLALAATVVIAMVVGYRVVAAARAKRIVLPREVAALSTWRPMTDVLLETPGRQMLRNPAPLGASIINVNNTGVPR